MNERNVSLSRIVQPVSTRIVKVSGRWFLRDLERPGELVPGPLYKRRRDAADHAERYASALWERLREQAGPSC